MIILIAAIGLNNELGLNGTLPWNIPEDMKHFRNYTMGKVIIMGRNTFHSIGDIPLSGRKCVVITNGKLQGPVVVNDIASALSIETLHEDLVIAGGESIYRQTINLADKLIITHIDADFSCRYILSEYRFRKMEDK